MLVVAHLVDLAGVFFIVLTALLAIMNASATMTPFTERCDILITIRSIVTILVMLVTTTHAP